VFREWSARMVRENGPREWSVRVVHECSPQTRSTKIVRVLSFPNNTIELGGLFQKTEKGYQPVHYVSRTLTDVEKRYSQIERELALAAVFTTSRLRMYLLGAKHFELVTDHKPLPPMFNKPKAKLPPRIERWL
jgi:hypothetical protein